MVLILVYCAYIYSFISKQKKEEEEEENNKRIQTKIINKIVSIKCKWVKVQIIIHA